ncbi:hypothetical protein [Dethiobacter alkaliphilus]|uniref:Uncharacterized protein n=1 Tax=Dethiobacter alkaliphilus AHT 1 TaxID=555088 RepID=C0GI11_DETAL|nr:hypothetical protein [Dethiobacter alkaliphilus]EEG77085.1 hypothetical protein DealDRAFT_2120 [Dethiobacter alkaliphilus AHT 1]
MRKMDEMEHHIALRSMRIAYSFTVVFLFVWMTIDFINTSELGLPFILLISQNIILLSSQLIMQNRMGRNEE